MKFTLHAYETLIADLMNKGYEITNYHEYRNKKRPCILRHDVDMDLSKAARFAQFEERMRQEVRSTYFILVSSDFYNVFSSASDRYLQQILAGGHEIGLHFDEAKYKENLVKISDNSKKIAAIRAYIKKETEILSEAIKRPVKTVSMHRPSRLVLESDISEPNLVNSYSQTFFCDFKYVSDSRCSWREDVSAIIKSGGYQALHILTHPFWYAKEEETVREKLLLFLNAAKQRRYEAINENFKNLEEFVGEKEVR